MPSRSAEANRRYQRRLYERQDKLKRRDLFQYTVFAARALLARGSQERRPTHHTDPQDTRLWPLLRRAKEDIVTIPASYTVAQIGRVAEYAAMDVQRALLDAGRTDQEAIRLWAHSWDVLTWAGERSAHELDTCARLAAEFWDRAGDPLRYAEALLVRAHLHFDSGEHVAEPEKERHIAFARDLIQCAKDVLTTKARHQKPQDNADYQRKVSTTLHQATLWQFRLSAFYPGANEDAARKDLTALCQLAHEIDSDQIWAQTHREEAGFTIEFQNAPEAREKLSNADERYQKLSITSPHLELGIVRANLEVCLWTTRTPEVEKEGRKLSARLATIARRTRNITTTRLVQKFADEFGSVGLELPTEADSRLSPGLPWLSINADGKLDIEF